MEEFIRCISLWVYAIFLFFAILCLCEIFNRDVGPEKSIMSIVGSFFCAFIGTIIVLGIITIFFVVVVGIGLLIVHGTFFPGKNF